MRDRQARLVAGRRSPRWSFARARRAAAEIRAAPLGDQAVATLRPPGVSGLARARAPLALLLYVAVRDGQVVEQDGGGFAVVRRPTASRPARSGGRWLRLLRWLDHHWDLAVFAFPPAAAIVVAALAALLAVARLAALLTVVAAMLWICVFLTGTLVRQVGWVARMGAPSSSGQGRSAESLPGYHWSAPLVHEPDPDRLDELLQLMTEQLAALIRADLQVSAGDTARVGDVDVTEPLVIPETGISSPETREAIAESLRTIRASSPDDGVILLAPRSRLEQVPRRHVAGGGFLLLYVAGLTVVIAVCARFAADTEASACGPAACRGHPVTYILALRWLLQRLLFSDPAGLSPGTAQAMLLGWLVSAAAAMLVVVAYVAARQEIARNQQAISRHDERLSQVAATGRVLILVVTSEERDAVLRSVCKHVGQGPAVSCGGRRTVYALGSIAGTELLLAQAAEQGTASVNAMYETARSAIGQCRPDYVILTGICFGLRPDEGQRMSDIVVAREVRNLDHRKVIDDGGVQRAIYRGAHVHTSPGLLDRFQAGESTWEGARVHYGLVLTSSVLVNSETTVARLREDFEDAIAGEMEGTSVYEAARLGVSPDWIMVKAISDWGHDKTDVQQRVAAQNAADFLVHVVASGALRYPRFIDR
jgi:nucleoside phosphorylase